jgi:osmotically-inducible protein OsmY
MKKMILLATMMLALQGCIFVVGAAAGGAAVSAVYDHRKLGQVTKDNRLNNRIIDQINTIPDLHDKAHISVTTFNGVVLLSGEALTSELSQQVENEAHKVDGISKVYNEIEIKGPSSSLTKASDSWITAKIKAQMLATKGLASGSIKVVTENGTVYLMGIVNRDQAENTVDIARQVAGVQRVIKIFQYTDK